VVVRGWPLEIFGKLKVSGHEQLIFFREHISRLRAIVAIHDTTLGPAIGGVRMWPYATEEEAVGDALKLSKAMTYKAAGAGLNFGGGQTVIIGDPRSDKSEPLFRALGRSIDGLGGRYIAAEGVGTNFNDMDYIRMETRYVMGIPSSRGGSGDPSPFCADGVIRGLEACWKFLTGSDNLEGLRVAVQGLGRVGSILVERLAAAGAYVIVTDMDKDAVRRIASDRDVEVVGPEEIYGVKCDIFSPCALGGILNSRTIRRLKCKVVAGAANNQLESPTDGDELHRRGILYAPDYIINAGGLINVADEIYGYDEERAKRKTSAIGDVLLRVLKAARDQGLPTYAAADRFAERRIEQVGRVRRSYDSA
jgi:leucine dehydrogenase